METKSIKLSKKEASPFLTAAGVNYQGRKFTLRLTETVTFSDTNWGDGTRNSYFLLNMENSAAKHIAVPAPWVNVVEGKKVTLPVNGIVIEHSIFCGRDIGITIHARPELVKWLTA